LLYVLLGDDSIELQTHLVPNPQTQEIIPRKYFAGGFDQNKFGEFGLEVRHGRPPDRAQTPATGRANQGQAPRDIEGNIEKTRS